MSRYVIIGDSHAGVYAGAVNRIAPEFLSGGGIGSAKVLWNPFFTHGPEGFQFSGIPAERYKMWQAESGQRLDCFERRVIVCLGLTPFPFYWNYQTWFKLLSPFPNDERRFISRGLLEATAAELQAAAIAFYEACFGANLLAAAVLPPPPSRTHPCISEFGPEFVRILSEIYTAPVLGWLRQNKVTIIDPELGDESGFMRPEYELAEDKYHASPACGPAVLKALRRLEGAD